jgi:hypothetical protein
MNNKEPLEGRCVKCVNFRNGNEKGIGYCSDSRAFKEVTGKTFRAGAPEGPTFEVRKLDGCSYWEKAW